MTSSNTGAGDSGTAVLNARPKITEVETHGIDTIPHPDRTSTWVDLLRIQFGGANTFATVLLGTFPIVLGLSFWQAVLATVAGVLVGTVFLMPMGLFGPRTGTNNAVSSGAFFGVRGRVVGSFLSLLTAIAFYSISVWVSGDALVGALNRLAGIEDSVGLRTLVYGVIGVIVIVVVVFGFQFMLLVNKTAVIANTALILLAFVAFSGTFDAGYNPGPDALALGGFWPTFVASALIVMANPISFGAFLGDWSRYIPKSTPTSKLLLATFLGQALTLIPFLFGVATATIVAGQADYVFALIQASPIWYAVLLMVVAFIGGLSTGTTSLYGTGLDFSSVVPRFSRVQATIGIGVIAFLFILTGRLFFDLLGAVNAFIGAIIVTTTPWMVIMAIGFIVRRGHFDARNLQVFNKGETGGIYWFNSGVNWRGMVAWIGAAVIGLLFANYPPVIVGPFSALGGGMDLSLVTAVVAGAVLYLGALWIFPEPRYVFGEEGPRLVPSSNAPLQDVVTDHASSAARVHARAAARRAS
ncbi:cytosine permease [Cryobacterium sp. MDB1-18-2]|uniref:Cytosine permease n=1 Tax=Cryobacterium glucosi TaxID=1259175 RepID=A0ABY2ILY6_9MICO|nr:MULTISPECIES: cytosine permease [Cryobacterium]MEB0003006.1 cytosine permease [Cryobacterium sp. RTC2.1]MEB0288111.1 cytosine permease [Cryobacterium sp. 10S3]MEB0304689.1 cytosine permease [Cryobacterium sp. 10I1]TFC17783.1 cytosine permease [Cryobacterium glucosi]TFC31922.1 cytosine permease [Cryobacterium sp. MDB1-18-2]